MGKRKGDIDMIKIVRLLLCGAGAFCTLFLCGYHHILEKVNPDVTPAMFVLSIIFIAVAAWLILEAYLSLKKENNELWDRLEELELEQKRMNKREEE